MNEVKELGQVTNTVSLSSTVNQFHQLILRCDASQLPFLQRQTAFRGPFPTPATLTYGPGLHSVNMCGVIPAPCQVRSQGMGDGFQSCRQLRVQTLHMSCLFCVSTRGPSVSTAPSSSPRRSVCLP